MPRKLPAHSQKLFFMLRNTLPKNWQIKELDNISDENDLYNILKNQKYFYPFHIWKGWVYLL